MKLSSSYLGPGLRNIYNILYKVYGPQKWWPADSAFEVIIGAILTQNTSWSNVEKAITNLKKAKKLSAKALYKIDKNTLAKLIRPSGYYNIKAARLKSFINYFYKNYKGSLKKFFAKPVSALRQELLLIKGIGPETADSIILYAAKKPIFVIDAYTKRIFSKQGLAKENASYDELQRLFYKSLPKSVKLFNEYHALIVRHGKDICRKKPLCHNCAIKNDCRGNDVSFRHCSLD